MTNDDDTITLADAAQHYGYTILTLRAEAERGRLTIYKIGRRYYTTPTDIKNMVQQCRVDQKARGSISIQREKNGSSGTDRISAAQDALSLMLEARKSSSRNTSDGNTNQRRQAHR